MYALNNPLKFTDPSGYKYGPTDYEREIARGEHTYYNWEMAWKLSGNRTPFANAFEWGRTVGGYSYNWATGKYDNSFSGSSISASSFSNGVVPYLGGMLSPEATGRVIDALNSLNSQTTANNSLTGRSWNLPLMQARGFDNHIFQYNRETGLFYAPWTDLQVDPLAILAESMITPQTQTRRSFNNVSIPFSMTDRTEIPILNLSSPFGTANYSLYRASTAGRSPANMLTTNGRKSLRLRSKLGSNGASINLSNPAIQLSRGFYSIGFSSASGFTSELKFVLGNHEYGLAIEYAPSPTAIILVGVGAVAPTILPYIIAL